MQLLKLDKEIEADTRGFQRGFTRKCHSERSRSEVKNLGVKERDVLVARGDLNMTSACISVLFSVNQRGF